MVTGISGRLNSGEYLQLSENPWDLFISGLEVNTCQSPLREAMFTRALMSFVMDGRNALIVKKNKNGDITGRSVLRIGLDKSGNPSLFMEPIYTKPENSAPLFMEAAQQIAKQMKLPLYSQQDMEGNSYKDASDAKEPISFLSGRTPFEYFDSLGEGVRLRQEETIPAVKISS